uniref:Retrovirus-related Pol polyprotein from transposon TNT 1-94 n=1 Tax=Cajanus cajan TaxID=3821 RepID=A0A151TC34_CAJCA|nr:Retrovirus-related Pol polyprotein from transposon TNT 1-94 [Cajanus cajan]
MKKECPKYASRMGVSSKDSFIIIMLLVAHYDLELHQIDVKTVFLNGDIEEMIYMMQLEDFVSNDSKSMVLKQASRQWYHKFHHFLVLYVNDILLANSDIGLLHETNRFLTKNFEMKDLGETFFVLGIKILRDRSHGVIRLSQENYIDKVLARFGMKDSKPRDTPIAKGDKYSLKQSPNDDLERNEMQL